MRNCSSSKAVQSLRISRVQPHTTSHPAMCIAAPLIVRMQSPEAFYMLTPAVNVDCCVTTSSSYPAELTVDTEGIKASHLRSQLIIDTASFTVTNDVDLFVSSMKCCHVTKINIRMHLTLCSLSCYCSRSNQILI